MFQLWGLRQPLGLQVPARPHAQALPQLQGRGPPHRGVSITPRGPETDGGGGDRSSVEGGRGGQQQQQQQQHRRRRHQLMTDSTRT